MNNFSKTKLFVIFLGIFWLLLSGVYFWKGDFYVSQAQIIIIGRGENEKRNIEQVVQNIQYFPYGIKNLEISRIKESGILNLEVVNQQENEAFLNLNKNIRQIFSTLSQHYNIKEEVAVSLIGEKRFHSAFWEKLREKLLLKLTLGFILSGFLTWLFPKIGKIFSERKTENFRTKKKLTENIFPQEEIQPSSRGETAIFPEVPTILDMKKNALSKEKKSSAPSNLPVGGDEIEKMFGASKNGWGYKMEEKKGAPEPPQEEKSALYREATPEEVKERLNKLLGNI